jgi:hypothetical protein
MMMLDEFGRPRPPEDAGELETLLGFLEFQRATFEWKCSGLDAEGMKLSALPSSMTLGGMMKHLALVEDYWFSKRLWDRDRPEPWASVDWDADPDWEWHSAANDSPDELRELWRRAVAHSRANVTDALPAGGLEQRARNGTPDDSPSLRWIICHMVEEYARHNGHADYLR